MTAQAAIFDPVPAHARHLFFDLNPAADCRHAPQALAAQWDGRSAVLGIGLDVVRALGVRVAGLRRFPVLPDTRPLIPVTQYAMWMWLRGDEPGDLRLRGHALQALIAPAFKLTQAIVSFRHRDYDDASAFAHVKRTAQEGFEPEAFVVRRSMPWVAGDDAGLVFLAFGKSFDAFDT